jgi:hypothetical protein
MNRAEAEALAKTYVNALKEQPVSDELRKEFEKSTRKFIQAIFGPDAERDTKLELTNGAKPIRSRNAA